jgi:hypothetical protein
VGRGASGREEVRDELRAGVSPGYSGRSHFAFTTVASSAVTVGLWAQVRAPSVAELALVPGFFVLCCFLEYLEHRYLLHQRTRLGAAAFRIHTLEHHRFYTEEDFQPESLRDYAFILFPPRCPRLPPRRGAVLRRRRLAAPRRQRRLAGRRHPPRCSSCSTS